MTAIEFPPMQRGASFNLDAVKAKIEAAGARSPSRYLPVSPNLAAGVSNGSPPAATKAGGSTS